MKPPARFLFATQASASSARHRCAWFAAAGFVALLLGIVAANEFAPVALPIGATRDVSCTVLMALGGLAAGLLVALLTSAGTRVESVPDARATAAPVAR
jgi:hypothetical protein